MDLPRELVKHIFYFRSDLENFLDRIEILGSNHHSVSLHLLSVCKDQQSYQLWDKNKNSSILMKILFLTAIKTNNTGALNRIIEIATNNNIDLKKTIITSGAFSSFDLTREAIKVAYKNGYLGIIEILCQVFGNAKVFAPVEIKSIDQLVQNKQLEILKLSKETYYKNEKLCYDRATIYAAENGDLEMLKWLKENTVHCRTGKFLYPSTQSIKIAQQKGYLDVVQWDKENYPNCY